jgi:signal transduction histidine kinase/CheY-like chemotaxis protein
MERYKEGFSSQVDVPPQWVSLFPLILGMLVLCSSVAIPDPDIRWEVQVAGAWITVVAPLSWLFTTWNLRIGKAFDLALIAAVVVALVIWQDAPALLPLLVVPTGLAGILIGLPAAAVAAGLEMLLLFGWRGIGLPDLGWDVILTTVTGVWTTVGLMAVISVPGSRTVEWAWGFYQEALRLREETFAYREALEQTLLDLGNANRQLAMAAMRMAGLRTLAEEAQKTKTMFLAKVSHEFRTPLNMIIGLVQLMGSPHSYTTALPPEMESDLQVVLRNCQHLSSMVDDVLDLTRVEAGRIRLDREWIRLSDIVAEAISAVRPLVEKKGLRLELDIPDDLPDVYCDRTRIRQVVLNLVSNATRFTEQGSVAIRVHASDGYIVTRVTDTGPGISADSLAKIFEPFAQGDSGLWRDKGGTGLGLAISQQFVQLHRGRLWVESEPDVGSSFNFKLPIPQAVDHIAGPGQYINEDWIWWESAFRTEGAGIADQVHKPRVLLLDRIGSLYPELVRFSHDIDLSDIGDLSNAQEALQNQPASLLLLNSEVVPEPPVAAPCLRSALPGTLFVQCAVPAPDARAAAAGASGYLIKPVSTEGLTQVIRDTPGPVKRVLVVDDDPDIRDLYARMLRGCNGDLDVATAANGEEAYSRLCTTPFDLVLLDLVMPDMDGWTVLERIRNNVQTANLPVYLVSAQDPADEPVRSPYLFVTAEGGFSVKRLLRCSLELSQLLMEPEGELDPTPPPPGGDGLALRDRQSHLVQAPDSLL